MYELIELTTHVPGRTTTNCRLFTVPVYKLYNNSIWHLNYTGTGGTSLYRRKKVLIIHHDPYCTVDPS
jgi:hypothetical protein